MSHINKQPGIYYLVTCFQNESQGGAKNLYCYTNRNILEITWAWIILISGLIVLFKRYQKHKDITRFNRKQIIVTIMVINMCAYLSYQWSYESALLYFPEYYFQYIFYCYTIYYFGRKSIILGMLNMRMDVSSQDIDPIIQLKLSKLFCIGLCSFFTIIFIMNYVQYFFIVSDNNEYDLCSASFFNVVTTVGFFMQGLFILQVKQLSRQVNKNLRAQKFDDPMMKLKEQIQKNQSSLWILVIFCFFGSFANFMQNVYFVSKNAKYKDNVGYFTCWYVNLSNAIWNNCLNALIGTTIKFFDFFLPYFLAIKTFWYNSNEQQLFNTSNSDQNEVEVYELQLSNNKSQQTPTQHIQEDQ
ncbi:unnamed protein product (macronuclear) [Paramecium tetraurelia]|uniref:Transmembrane protein n=1 Tax=Paramecium tetraurelia TaxID=5888 RepID=A0BNT7_PARTE|nr:uncharacterized protein GSPATT00030843001 [Paramecium tetraurelia]CAK60204.1 unnamed protein product [Paramecium tetraurelia]|eukprot:XP_001427602.1 hypothetical protein (macronuclear) [Paramecium tetraurelia strain d4-2]